MRLFGEKRVQSTLQTLANFVSFYKKGLWILHCDLTAMRRLNSPALERGSFKKIFLKIVKNIFEQELKKAFTKYLFKDL